MRIPAVVDAHDNKIVALLDAHGRPESRLIAELVLEAFRGPCPPGHRLYFKDGNRLNCTLANLEWAPTPSARNDGAREQLRPGSGPTRLGIRSRADIIATAPSWYLKIANDEKLIDQIE